MEVEDDSRSAEKARDALGMKQWELGLALGVSEAEVCLWEKANG